VSLRDNFLRVLSILQEHLENGKTLASIFPSTDESERISRGAVRDVSAGKRMDLGVVSSALVLTNSPKRWWEQIPARETRQKVTMVAMMF
jgi:hypothetical protein